METKLRIYHYQADEDPYAKQEPLSMWMPTSFMKDIMYAYEEEMENRREN